MRATLTARALVAALLPISLGGCAAKLSAEGVRHLFDAADRAYLQGDVSQVCDLRTDDFRLDSTYFELARGRTVADRAEADAIESDAAASGARAPGERASLDHKQFCMLAFDARKQARGARLERGAIDITIDQSAERATVRVHYVLLQPEYSSGESAHDMRDASSRQVASRRTESDEESVVVRDGGKLKIASTRATSWTFLVPPVRDTRL